MRIFLSGLAQWVSFAVAPEDETTILELIV